ncbi:hypothetical protein K8R20_01550 [bacterium]|nr:hypothetical protein [bacterium]
MNNKTVLTITWICIFTILFPVFSTLAEELDSTNYKLVGVTTQGGDSVESTNYSSLLTLNETLTDPTTYSTNYKSLSDPVYAFRPAVPEVSCFETTTSGTSNCTTGPVELPAGGMVVLCGGNGCYNRARFEIDTNDNPTDTLYAIQISTDNFVSDTNYIDAATYEMEPYSAHNINDFRTQTQWETDTFNILGLASSTQYYIRIIALHGDLTQTEEGPSDTATTTEAASSFDIDIAIESGTSTETSPPYTISFTGSTSLLAGAGTVTADDLVWFDAETNGVGGFAVVQQGANGGLYSATHSVQIDSITGNLDTTSEGFGLQSYYIANSNASSELGDVTAMTNYAGSISNVGIVDTDWNKVYDGDGAIVDGRMALYLKARAAADKQGATDYNETITFIFVPRY